MLHVYVVTETAHVNMYNYVTKPHLSGGTVTLLYNNHIICSLYMEDLLPTKHSSFSLQEDERNQENIQRQDLQGNSSQTNSTRCSALPPDVDEQAITSPKTVGKDVHSPTVLKHVPKSNATSKQQWINS